MARYAGTAWRVLNLHMPPPMAPVATRSSRWARVGVSIVKNIAMNIAVIVSSARSAISICRVSTSGSCLACCASTKPPRAEPLPPGIQRRLERGKPLPPGIAKRFDGPIAQQLPRYPGYEWERVGADVVLIEAATRVVVDILVDALR
ncbi:anti-virulence regulator CigR family protein [Halomonas sp. BC1]|uniref:anti-virulence regulator CigR family protein n=1 Tax=Halomonas sp. BC1 TaxID=1670448 RepID=UPI00406D1837